jgi:uncharacterized protein (DUF779 family)
MKKWHVFKSGLAVSDVTILVSLTTIVVIASSPSAPTSSAQADPGVLYVTSGGNCDGASPCYGNMQGAVDAARDGDVKVATGIYTDVNTYGGLKQIVYISKTTIIQGGYTITNWTMPYPIARPTMLDAQGQGRMLYIAGNISSTVEGLDLTGGNAAGLGGDPWGDTGGEVYIAFAKATVSNCRIYSNTAGRGGGVVLY